MSCDMEVVTSFRFIFIISRPFGIFPYKPEKWKNFHVLTISENISRQSKILYWAFAVLKMIILLLDISVGLTMSNRFNVIFREGNTMIVYLLMALAYRSVLVHSIPICHWLNKINKILCSINTNFSQLTSSNQALVLYSLTFCLVTNLSALVDLWTNYKFIDNWIGIIDSLIFATFLIVENLFICQFIIFVGVVRLFFMKINEKFEEEYVKCQTNKISVIKLQDLRTLHSSATDFYDYLNVAFELNLFFYISWAFFSLLCSAVSIVLFDVNDAITLIYWSIYHPCQIVPILYMCDSVSKEAKRAAHHLHELLSVNLSPCIKEEIEIFSLQLQHRPVHFNVYGFFDLNFALLHSMVATITTYTIALLQVPSLTTGEENKCNINLSLLKNSSVEN